MTGEPARQHDNVRDLRPRTVPWGKYQAVTDALIQAQNDLEIARADRRRDQRIIKALRHALRKAYDLYAPDKEADEFFGWWVRATGRNPKRTKVDKGTDRYDDYKKLRKRWSRREIALAVVGARNHHYAPFRKRDDMQDLQKSTKWMEECLSLGERVMAERQQQEAA